MTEKLYYSDSHIKEFDATVLSCEKQGSIYAVTLDKTAFFPEGGGQAADTGILGSASVTDAQEIGGEIRHFCDRPLSPGETVTGTLDWDKRFRNMQNHSGEHIVSGTIHSKYGYNNVGFHMGADGVTLDIDGPLSAGDIDEIEYDANRVVFDNVPITADFPSEAVLSSLEYRSKLDISKNVRIVTISGCDMCACCAPHVKHTGEIGPIKLLDFAPHRGGTRIIMKCGLDAMDDYIEKSKSSSAISALLSSRQKELPQAVCRILGELENEKQKKNLFIKKNIDTKVNSLSPTDGNICLFESDFDTATLRSYVNSAVELCGGICAAFSGSDDTGYNYVMASRNINMLNISKDINLALNGRGGGKSEMIQGSVYCKREDIEEYFN